MRIIDHVFFLVLTNAYFVLLIVLTSTLLVLNSAAATLTALWPCHSLGSFGPRYFR